MRSLRLPIDSAGSAGPSKESRKERSSVSSPGSRKLPRPTPTRRNFAWDPGYFVPQRQSDPRQLFTGSWRRGRRLTSRKHMKLGCLQLQNHCAGDSRFLARGRPGFFRKAPDHWFGLGQQYILLKGILGGDRLGRPVGYDRVLVDSPRQFVEALPVAAKMCLSSSRVRARTSPTERNPSLRASPRSPCQLLECGRQARA